MTQPLLTRRAAGLAAAAVFAPLTGARANDLQKPLHADGLMIATERHFAPFDFTKAAARLARTASFSRWW